MKLFSLLLAVVLSGCATQGYVGPSEKASFSHLRQATWELTGDEGSCSAVTIAEGLALTAAHCDMTNARKGLVPIEVVKKSDVADIMLIKVEGLACPCVPVGLEPATDDVVATVGYPLGLGQVLTQGRVQGPVALPEDVPQEVKDAFAHLIIVTSPVVFGNSGGPVFVLQDVGNDVWEFRVVGIVSRVAVANLGMFPNLVPHLAFVVNQPTIKEFLER